MKLFECPRGVQCSDALGVREHQRIHTCVCRVCSFRVVLTLFASKIFFACGALKGASPSPMGLKLVSPKSVTLAVTIIPVTPEG